MHTDINHSSLLHDYYYELEGQLQELSDNVSQAIKWQLITQCRDLNEDGLDEYQQHRFRMFKCNWFQGTMTHEDDMNNPVFVTDKYIPQRYFY